jgi:hypothetical protein
MNPPAPVKDLTPKPPKEIAFYYPNPMWRQGDWIKNLILFFDGVALLVPSYMRDKPDIADPAIVTGLREHGLLHIIEPETAVDKAATEQLASALMDIISSGALDNLATTDTKFHEISRSRLGYDGDSGLAQMILEELQKRGLAKAGENDSTIPIHPMVRSLVLVLLSQILRPYGARLGAELSPTTDNPRLVEALTELLSVQAIPTTGHVVEFDLNTVSVDLGSIPIDEVLTFRKENFADHRRYCLAARLFAQQLSKLSDEERKTAFALRQAELDDIAQDLKGRATKTWKKPASFALTLSGAALALANGHPLAAALTVGAAVTGYQAAAKRDAGAYSYLFRAHDRYPY